MLGGDSGRDDEAPLQDGVPEVAWTQDGVPEAGPEAGPGAGPGAAAQAPPTSRPETHTAMQVTLTPNP